MGDKEEVLEAVLKETVDLVTDLLKVWIFFGFYNVKFSGRERV